MSLGMLLLLCLLVGWVSGLRSMTGIALVCWGVHLGWLHPAGRGLGFLASVITLVVFSLFALGEMVADKLPVPPRTTPGPLAVRVLFGGFCACVLAASRSPEGWMVPILLGAVGAVAGTFAGYHARRAITARPGVKDLPVALAEDVVAVLLGLFVVSRF